MSLGLVSGGGSPAAFALSLLDSDAFLILLSDTLKVWYLFMRNG
jgi:hypothetical protein